MADEGIEISVTHRAFALAPTEEHLIKMFGSKRKAKQEILGHWRAANENDDQHRIRADEMAEQPHDYPYSTPALLACKAAEALGGMEAHWDYFDETQKAHLTEVQDVTEHEVLLECARKLGFDKASFEQTMNSQPVRQALEHDWQQAQQDGVRSVPTLILNQKYQLSGAVKYPPLKDALERVSREAVS